MGEISSMTSIECGREAAEEFDFDPDWKNLNHGSFGAYPNAIGDELRHLQIRCENRVDEYIRYTYPQRLDESRRAIAEYVNAPVDACVFVPNCTTALNTIVRNLVFEKGDVIIYFATVYGANEKTFFYLTETTPVDVAKVEFVYPISDDDLCNAFEQTIERVRAAGKNPRLAVYDTVIAMPGVRMPFERLTELCRKHRITSIIDGAHGVGHIPLDLTALNPDYFFSNCHKWLGVPRGCALLYVPFRNQHLMRSTLPTSHHFEPYPRPDGTIVRNPLPPAKDKSPWVLNFQFVGTLDNTPYLTIPAALSWRSKLSWKDKQGEAAHFAYCVDLARRAGEIISAKLGTETLSNHDPKTGRKDTLGECNFTAVRLPLEGPDLVSKDMGSMVQLEAWLNRKMVQDFQTFVPLILYHDAWWARLSAQVYLTEQDFEWAAEMLAKLCERARLGEWKVDSLSLGE